MNFLQNELYIIIQSIDTKLMKKFIGIISNILLLSYN